MKKIISLAIAFVMIFSLAAVVASAEEKTVLVLGTSADYAPFEFMYPDADGNMVYGGIDVMVAQYVADYLGLELQIENMDFGYLLTALNKGDFDIVLADIEPTEKRLKAADFSDPYYEELPEMLLIRAEDADKYKDVATDFDGVYVGAQAGSTKVEKAEACEGCEVVALPLVTDLVNELVNGKIDAVLLDGSVAKQYVNANSGLAIADASEYYNQAVLAINIAVAKGDPKGLLEGINAAIAQLKADNGIEEIVAAVNMILDTAEIEEVSADAPEGYTPDD